MMPPTVRDREVSKNGVCCVESVGGTSERQDTRYSMSVLDCLGSVLHERTSSSSYDDFSSLPGSHFNIATLRHSQCRFIAEHCSSQFLMPLLVETCASPSIQDAFSLPHQRDWDVKMARPTATGHWPATGPACLSPPKSSIGLDGMR